MISRQTFEDATKRQNKVPFKNYQFDFVYPKHKIIGALSQLKWHLQLVARHEVTTVVDTLPFVKLVNSVEETKLSLATTRTFS